MVKATGAPFGQELMTLSLGHRSTPVSALSDDERQALACVGIPAEAARYDYDRARLEADPTRC
jgi:hypothetical protein